MPLGWFSIALHISAEDLRPEDISSIFGVSPTESQTKGVPLLRSDGTLKRVPKFGRWSIDLKPSETDEWDIGALVTELLAPLPKELATWRKVAAMGSLRISLGLDLSSKNQEFEFDPELLRFLGEREIFVYFDIYSDAD